MEPLYPCLTLDVKVTIVYRPDAPSCYNVKVGPCTQSKTNNKDSDGHFGESSSEHMDASFFKKRDTRLAGYMTQMCKNSKFSGNISQSIELTIHLY